MLFTNILFPVDFSERSRAIVPHVKAVCDRFNSTLTLLHLIEVRVAAFSGVEAPVMLDFPMDEMKKQANRQLHRFAEASFPGLPVNIVVDEGDPGSCVAELARAIPMAGAGNVPDVVRHAAEEHNADLVVIGRGALPQFAGRLRSNVYSIVPDMPCPVLSILN